MYIGFDKVDITPQRPCYMAGYNRPGMNESILDSIQINSLCLSIDNETFVLVVLDSIMLDPVFCTRVKAGITSRTGVHPSHITVACIHTHSAPAYFKLAFEDTHVEPELTEDAERHMIESACRAHANMQPATCTFEKMLVDGLYGNRNVRGGVEDKHCYLITFQGEDGTPLGAIFNVSAHPTILNGSSTALSADLIGQVRLRLEDALGCQVLCTNGTCGDVSTRFYRKSSGIDELNETADALFEQVMVKKTPVELHTWTPRCGSVSRPTTYDARTDRDWEEMTARIQEDLASPEPQAMSAFLMDRQQRKLEMSPVSLELTSQFYSFGTLIVVTMPGDVCSELGRRIKAAFPEHEVIIIGYANTYCNYLVPNCDYGKYFETFNSRTARGEADAFVQSVIDSIESMIAE